MPRQASFASTLFVITAACTGGVDRPQIVERDSAGIHIVEHPVGYAAPAWTVSAQPQLDIGQTIGDTTTLLYQVEGVHRLSDGRIVVANRSSHELRYYDAEGNHLFSSGREGEGPGEFGYIAWTMSCGGDSVTTYDISTRRMSVFDPHGRYVRGVMLEMPTAVGPYGDGTCAGDGTFLMAGWPQYDSAEGPHRPTRPLALLGPDGKPVADLGVFPGGERYSWTINGRPAGSGPRPLGRETYHVLAGERFYLGTSDAYEIGVYDRSGALEQLIRQARTDLELTEEVRETFVETELARATSDNQRRGWAAQYARMEWPQTLPAYGRFILDAVGNLWVEEYRRPGATNASSWNVFATNGRHIASVELPSGFTVFEIGEDYVLGTWRDEFDVEHVRTYALLKPDRELP